MRLSIRVKRNMRRNAGRYFVYAVIFCILFWTSPVVRPPASAQLVSVPVEKPEYDRVLYRFKARLTEYSRADSCHNKNAKGECIMASGKAVYEGAVACPYVFELGTKLRVNGELVTCEDRYQSCLDNRFHLPTIDRFVEENPHGAATVFVEVVQ